MIRCCIPGKPLTTWRVAIRGGLSSSPQNKYNLTTGEWDQTAITAYPNIYTSDVGGTRYAGHWLQIKLPYAITLSHSNVHPTNGYGLDRAPKDGVILGSNDGEYWYKLTKFSGKTYFRQHVDPHRRERDDTVPVL